MATYQDLVDSIFRTDYGGRTKRLRKKMLKYRGASPAMHRKFGRVIGRAVRMVWAYDSPSWSEAMGR